MSASNLTNKISDIKKLSDEKKQGGTVKLVRSPSRGMSSSNVERPASRAEIFSLEKELEDKVRMVLDSATFIRRNNDDFGAEFSYQPHRENVINTRDKMLEGLGATPLDIEEEPWLDSYLKCECLKVVCDEVSSQFSDIVGVSSTELGNVSRKLRLTYKQSFEQLAESWKSLRGMVKSGDAENKALSAKVHDLEEQIKTKEEAVAKRFDDDIARMHREFAQEKERDQEKIAQAQFKMDQMADTLKYLNGIFRTMQNDGSTLKTTDLQTVVSRLEKENRELKTLNNEFDSIRVQLSQAQQRIRQLESQILVFEDEKSKIQSQLARRDEAIASLMEREAVRAAEIEKLQKMAKLKDDELLSLDMKDPATSVLCIKCKRSLDDLTNIKAALLGDQAMGKIQRVQCETFRILLPNLKNRKPSRSNAWLRNAMRCILMSKMREHLAWQQLKPDVVRFPAYVYSWFSKKTTGLAGSTLTKLLVSCDEDRWALYYGCKALGKDDPEAALFWSLLDEAFGQDGLHFLLHCLGVVLTLGGTPLWNQFGKVLVSGASIEDKPDESEVRQTIWLELSAAKEAVALILTRALSVHVNAALEAIEALKVTPQDLDQRAETVNNNSSALASESSDSMQSPNPRVSNSGNNGNINVRGVTNKDATHVNLFTFLRVLQQQLHADKIHRSAAIRLMFETASVGALTPALPSYDNNSSNGGNSNPMGHNLQGVTNTHVEYPQFQSICLTLFPRISIAEIAGLYTACHLHGARRVSAEVFTQEADLRGLFVRAMVLPSLPLLRHLVGSDVFANSNTENETISNTNVLSSSPVNLSGNSNNSTSFNPKTKMNLRSQLSVLVHRKVASIQPLLTDYLFPRLPSVWSAALQDALHSVHTSLEETFTQLRQLRKREEEGTNGGVVSRLISGASSPIKGKSFAANAALVNAMSSAVNMVNNGSSTNNKEVAQATAIADTYLDGIQPYIAYRRLLSLLSLAIAVNDSPLLPTELFTAKQLALSTDKVVKRAETLLQHLEEAIVLPVAAAMETQDVLSLHQPRVARLLEKYHSFEDVRKKLVSHKMQTIVKQFVSREVAVPRSVRMLMAAGYLSDHRNRQIMSNLDIRRSVSQMNPGGIGNTGSGHAMGNAVVSAVLAGNKTQGLRWREVFLDPWVGSAQVASIYLFKLDYDVKAARLGLAPLSLPQAVSAYFYHILGTATAAERALHDLFVCVRNYRHAVSRLRLFSLFLGDARESGLVPSMSLSGGVVSTSHMSASEAAALAAEESGQLLVSVLASAQAWAVYLHLLMRVHAGVAEVSRKFHSDANDTGVADTHHPSDKKRVVIDTLFPSTDNPFNRTDKRDVWMVDMDVLIQVARQWTRRQQRHWHQPGMTSSSANNSGNSHSIYTDLPEKLKADAQNRVDVDDFLYLMVLQWAKLQVWQLQRVATRGQQMNNIVTTTSNTSSETTRDANKPVVSAEANPNNKGMLSRRLSQLPLSTLQSIADSVYQQRGSDAVISTAALNTNNPTSAINNNNNNNSKKRRNTEAETNDNDGNDKEEESLLLSDPMHYAAAYIRCIRSRRFAMSLPENNVTNNSSSVVGVSSKANVAHEQELLNRMTRIEKKLVQELHALIRETVLWDTNLGLFLTPERILWRHAHASKKRPVSGRVKAKTVSDASASIVQFDGENNNSNSVVLNKLNYLLQGDEAEDMNTLLNDEDDLFTLDILVTEACAPEYLYQVCKQVFHAYHSVVHTFLASALSTANAHAHEAAEQQAAIVGNPPSLNNPSALSNANNSSNNASTASLTKSTASADEAMVQNVRQRVQSVRAQLLALSDFFAQPEQNMASDRLYLLRRLGASAEDVLELETLRQQHRHSAREAQFLVRALISNVAELAVVAQLEFPRDSWHAGAKIHIDRAVAYSVHLRPSL